MWKENQESDVLGPLSNILPPNSQEVSVFLNHWHIFLEQVILKSPIKFEKLLLYSQVHSFKNST